MDWIPSPHQQFPTCIKNPASNSNQPYHSAASAMPPTFEPNALNILNHHHHVDPNLPGAAEMRPSFDALRAMNTSNPPDFPPNFFSQLDELHLHDFGPSSKPEQPTELSAEYGNYLDMLSVPATVASPSIQAPTSHEHNMLTRMSSLGSSRTVADTPPKAELDLSQPPPGISHQQPHELPIHQFSNDNGSLSGTPPPWAEEFQRLANQNSHDLAALQPVLQSGHGGTPENTYEGLSIS